ncbi:MAG: hypothetical protein JKY37_05210, partial [Nannocystaceae bacterium]|nr:hypothetical protein [Nannocystaceae bacterium]
ESCQHASCIGNSAEATLAKVPEEVFRAVRETSGMYLKYGDTLTYAFYVAGSKTFHGQTCIGDAGGAPTEKWVTYNNGKSDALVEQTKLGSVFVPSDNEYGQNRGCMSQWGARCLEQDGADALDILEFYYGEDIEVVQAQGDCVDATPPVGEASECGDGQCTGNENSDRCPADCEPCGVVAGQGETIVDEGSSCFSTTGDEQYIRHEAGRGHDGALLWTESTQSVAHTAGMWRMNFENAGRYRVEAFVEAGYAQEDRARYRVTHDGEESTLRVDQSRARGWVELGVFEFASGEHDQSVMLTDLSGTRGNTIVFDAIRIAKVEGDDEKFDDVEGGGRRGGEEGCSLGAPEQTDPRAVALMLLVVAASRRRQRSRG